MNSIASALRLPAATRGGTGLAALGAILFSAKAIVVKLAYRHGVHAEVLLGLRMLLSMPFFFAAFWWSSLRASAHEPGLPGRRDLALIVLAGVLGYYAASLLDFMGLEYISAGLERLILFTYPPMVLLINSALRRHWPGKRASLAMALSYAGLLLVYGHEARLEGGQVTLGALLVLASALCYGSYLIVAGELLRRLGSIRVTALASLVSGVMILVQLSPAYPLVGGVGAARAGLVAVLVQCHFLHRGAGVRRDDGDPAHRLQSRRPDRHAGPGVDDCPGGAGAGRTLHPVAPGRHHPGAGRNLVAGSRPQC